MSMAQRIRADRDILEAALVGLQHRREEIDLKVAELRERIAKMSPGMGGVPASARRPKKARVLSPAARQRIAAAQKKRWEAFRKSKAKQEKARAAKKPAKTSAGRQKKQPAQEAPQAPASAASA